MSLLQFMSDNPWLSLALAIIIGGTICSVAYAIVAAVGIWKSDCDCDDGE